MVVARAASSRGPDDKSDDDFGRERARDALRVVPADDHTCGSAWRSGPDLNYSVGRSPKDRQDRVKEPED
jgi:hypothetical protein